MASNTKRWWGSWSWNPCWDIGPVKTPQRFFDAGVPLTS